jgi:hypothetical protein
MFVPIIIGQELVLTRGAGASVIVDEAKRCCCSCCCDTVKTKTVVHKINIYLLITWHLLNEV